MIAVYCKDCIHHEECNAARVAHGIITFVEGLVDCDGYEAKDNEGETDDRE